MHWFLSAFPLLDIIKLFFWLILMLFGNGIPPVEMFTAELWWQMCFSLLLPYWVMTISFDFWLGLAFRSFTSLPNRQTPHYVILKESDSWEVYLTYYNIISLFQSIYSTMFAAPEIKNVKNFSYNGQKDRTLFFHESGTFITAIICHTSWIQNHSKIQLLPCFWL